jgi:hypothetical protein
VARLQDEADLDDGSAPVFVLGAGWRTGSTLVQRVLNSAPGVLVWGEPFSEASLVPRLADSLKFLDPRHGHFDGDYFVLGPDQELPDDDDWTALMSPPLEQLVRGCRRLLDETFASPARDHGCSRWGVKEVVWDGDCIRFLRLLYPQAKFVLLVRDPQSQWRSYRPMTSPRPWFYRWPDAPVRGPWAFAAMWDRLVRDFVEAEKESASVALFRYEDLGSPTERARLSEHVGLGIPGSAFERKVGTSASNEYYDLRIPRWERTVIESRTRVGRGLLDYSGAATRSALVRGWAH